MIIVAEQAVVASHGGLMTAGTGGLVDRRKIGFELVRIRAFESRGVVCIRVGLMAG